MDQTQTKTLLRDEKGRLLPGGCGRPKGATDKFNRTVRETVLSVFNDLQNDPKTSLKSFAETYPRDFYQMAARLIPLEITGSMKHIINVTDPDEVKEEFEQAEIVSDDGN